MRPLRDDTQLILDGEVRVYRRANSGRWQAAFVVDGALLMAWMSSPSVMASTLITLVHYDAVRMGHPCHQQSRVSRIATQLNFGDRALGAHTA